MTRQPLLLAHLLMMVVEPRLLALLWPMIVEMMIRSMPSVVQMESGPRPPFLIVDRQQQHQHQQQQHQHRSLKHPPLVNQSTTKTRCLPENLRRKLRESKTWKSAGRSARALDQTVSLSDGWKRRRCATFCHQKENWRRKKDSLLELVNEHLGSECHIGLVFRKSLYFKSVMK